MVDGFTKRPSEKQTAGWLESLRLAVAALRANKLRAALTSSGIVVGVFLIFVLLTVGGGTVHEAKKLITDLAPNAVAVVHGYFPADIRFKDISFSLSEAIQNMGDTDEGLPLFGSKFSPEMSDTLEKELPRGCISTPLSVDIAKAKFGDRSRTAMIFATNENYAEVRRQALLEGRYFESGDKGRRVCVLGSYLAEKIFGEIDPVGRDITVRGSRFRVVGVMEPKGMTFVVNNDDFLFVPYWVGGHLGPDRCDGFLISAPTRDDMARAKESATRALRRLVGGKGFTVVTQDEMLALAADATRIYNVASSVIAIVAFLVGGIGIMCIMLVSVTERITEIGVRKALGARGRDILSQFLAESLLLGLAGGLIGIAMGLVFLDVVRSLFDFPVRVETWPLFCALFFSIAVGVLFGVWPAMKAARLEPVESLRHEL